MLTCPGSGDPPLLCEPHYAGYHSIEVPSHVLGKEGLGFRCWLGAAEHPHLGLGRAPQIEDWVNHKLTGAMVRDLATAVASSDGEAQPGELGLAQLQVLGEQPDKLPSGHTVT